jgi:hypothetical protein
VLQAGQPAQARMQRQYKQHIVDLSLRRWADPKTIGKRSKSMRDGRMFGRGDDRGRINILTM